MNTTAKFTRHRRTRMTPLLRSMVRETELSKNDFIYPLFSVPGKNIRKEISSMQGVYQMSIDNIVKECEEVKSLGIPAVILFGIPPQKDEAGSGAYDPNGIIQQTVRAIKKEVPEIVVITDVCLCEYTSHGHCGIVRGEEIVNDASIELLAKEALTHAQAGADMIAPSDMFDGRVQAISMHPVFMDRSAKRQKAHLNLATDVRIKWIPQIPMRQFVKLKPILKKALILLW
jgi:porphobilinogen synthase